MVYWVQIWLIIYPEKNKTNRENAKMNVNIIVDKIEPYIEYAVSFLNDSFCKDNKFLLFTLKDYKKNENI